MIATRRGHAASGPGDHSGPERMFPDRRREDLAMADRIPLVDPDDDGVDESTRALLAGMREVGGDFNVIRALATPRELLEGFMSLSSVAYGGSRVDPPLRELAYLTAS